MRNTTRWLVALSIAFALIPAGQALADESDGVYAKNEWPLPLIKRPLTLASGMIELAGNTAQISMSKDLVGDPTSLAPSIFYGVNNALSVGIVHTTGICISGDLCAEVYDDFALEAHYGLMRAGNFQVAARGGLAFPKLADSFTGGLLLGLNTRLSAGKIAVVVEPAIYVGVIERSTEKEQVALPVELQFQLNNQTAVFASSGLNGPLKDFGDTYLVPVGLGALFAINNRIDIGAEFEFTNLAGKDSSADGRALYVRAALRL